MSRPNPPTEEQYRDARIREALDFAPTIIPCMKCHWPVARGYCCNYCGDTNPSEPDEQP